MYNLDGKLVPSDSSHLFGFVSAGYGQGTMMGWNVYLVRQTEKAVCLRCTETGKTAWLPKSTVKGPNADGDRELTPYGVRLIRDAGFRATACYGDVL